MFITAKEKLYLKSLYSFNIRVGSQLHERIALAAQSMAIG
jgi:predicted HicB family RNase H-like nuclease